MLKSSNSEQMTMLNEPDWEEAGEWRVLLMLPWHDLAVWDSLDTSDIIRMTINWFIEWFSETNWCKMFSLSKKRRSKEDLGEYSGDKR